MKANFKAYASIFTKLFFPHDGKNQHFRALDGLRGVAVLLVLLSHTSNKDIFFHEFLNFQNVGKVGVYLFFVLSAYLLDRQIAIALMANKSSKRYWANYFLRRFLRIYPLFVIALIFHGVLTLLGFKTVIDRVIDFPLHLVLVRGESIFWSIPVEFKYYFISPLIMFGCHKFLKWNTTYVLVALVGLTMLTIWVEFVYNLSIVSTFRYFPIFLIGTLISTYELLRKKTFSQHINPVAFDVVGLFSSLLIILTIPFYFQLIFRTSVNFQKSIFYFPYALLWGCMLIAAKYGKGVIRKLLEIRILRFFGTIIISQAFFKHGRFKFIGLASRGENLCLLIHIHGCFHDQLLIDRAPPLCHKDLSADAI